MDRLADHHHDALAAYVSEITSLLEEFHRKNNVLNLPQPSPEEMLEVILRGTTAEAIQNNMRLFFYEHLFPKMNELSNYIIIENNLHNIVLEIGGLVKKLYLNCLIFDGISNIINMLGEDLSDLDPLRMLEDLPPIERYQRVLIIAQNGIQNDKLEEELKRATIFFSRMS